MKTKQLEDNLKVTSSASSQTAKVECDKPCGEVEKYGRCYVPEGRYSYHFCPHYQTARRLDSPALFFNIPDNSKLLQLAEINHPRVIQFVRKLEKANPNCNYLQMQRGEYGRI